MTIANTLTIFRIFISPIFLLVYLYHREWGLSPLVLPFVLLLLLGISELSDAFDGYLARKYNQVTDFGKVFDPMADSIYRISVFLTFTIEPVKIPMGLVFMFLYRDSVVSTLRTICALKGFALAARSSGKIKAVVQAIAAIVVLVLMVLAASHLLTPYELTLYSTWVVSLAGLYSLYSGFDYIYANRNYIKRVLVVKTRPSPRPTTK